MRNTAISRLLIKRCRFLDISVFSVYIVMVGDTILIEVKTLEM